MLPSLILVSILSSVVSAITDHTNVALYWGQNSQGSQSDLATYCQSEDADIYILSFLYEFGGDTSPNVNFASACTSSYSDGLLHCSQIAEDIQTCQSLGKTILLSLGGATGNYGFTDDSNAEEFAGTLWNMFGGGSDDSVERPFDDAIVDGFDFDIENADSTGYAALANKLREYFTEDTSKTYYLSASPQCPYPDASVGDLLENAEIDFAFIQFYNNYCSTVGSSFNWDTWNTYAEDTSPNSDIKLFVGLPAGSGAAGSGYATIDEIQSTFEEYILNNEDTHFGGFALWDASWSSSNTVNDDTFGNNLQSILNSAYSDSGAISSSTSVTTSSLTSTSSSSTISTSTPTTSSSSTSSTTSTYIPSTEEIAFPTSSSTTLTTPTTSTSSSLTTLLPEVVTSSSSNDIEIAQTTNNIPTFTQVTAQVLTISTSSSFADTSIESSSTDLDAVLATTLPTLSITIPQSDEGVVSAEVTTATYGTTTAVDNARHLDFSTTLETLTTSSITSSSSATDATASSTSTSDCSSLSGLSKAKCLNKQFSEGLYLGSADSCTDGEIACSEDGSFAICNFGSWVNMVCSSGTTCYAYNYGDSVDVGCNYISSKSSYEKRDGYISKLFRRHFHSPHA